MASRKDLPDGMTHFERSLSAIAPRASDVDRDQLLFLAGRASAEGPPAGAGLGITRRWVWPLATVAMTAACISFATLYFRGPPERVIRQLVYVDQGSDQNRAAPSSANSHAIAAATRTRGRSARFPGNARGRSVAIARTDVGRGYIDLRQLILTDGLDAVPPADMSGVGSWPTAKSLRHLMIEMLPPDGQPGGPVT